MKKKLFSIVGLTYLLLLFTVVGNVSAADLNVLDLETNTDKVSYEYDENVISTIGIKNLSETNNAENIRVTIDLPEGVELVDNPNATLDAGSVIWDFEQISAGTVEELEFETLLPEPIAEPVEKPTKDPVIKNTDEQEDVVIPTKTDNKPKGEVKPQTGDESSAFTYIMILVASIVVVFIAIVAIREKRVSKVGVLGVALLIITPTFISNADTVAGSTYEQLINETYNVEIAGENYEYAVTISAEVPDYVVSIDVDPSELVLYPESFADLSVTGTKTSGDIVQIVEDENVSFEVSEPEKLVVDLGEEGLEINATTEAEAGDEIDITVVYNVNGVELTAAISVTIEAYTGVLDGKITDADTKEPIVGANVIVQGINEFSVEIETDENGEYATELEAGTYTIDASAEGYISEEDSVIVSPNHATTSDINLELVPEEFSGEGTASGKISNALTGDGVEGVEVKAIRGKNNPNGEVVEEAITDRDGNYSLVLNGGNYTILISTEEYISTTKNIISIGDKETANQNATITPELDEDEYRIVLTWGEEPWDLDSHFTGPTVDEDRFHVYFANKNYVDEESEVNLDLDDVSSYGPETITIIKGISNGTYTYGVFNYSGRSLDEDNKLSLAKSSAKVEVYKGSALVKTYHVPANKEGNMWKVFEIVDGELVTINKLETMDSPRIDNQLPTN